MRKTFLQIFVYSIPVILIAWLVLSIILFIKKDKIISKYNVGYFSSFFFASYMLTPITVGIPYLFSFNSNKGETIAGLIASFIFPIIGIIIFNIVYKNKSIEYRIGKFYAMLAIGICACYMLIFEMLRFIHHFENKTTIKSSTSKTNSPLNKPHRLYGEHGEYQGYIDANGRRYGEHGEYQGYIDANGRRYGEHGEYQGYIDANGRKYGKHGEYQGYIDANGRNYGEHGEYQGYSSKN